MTVYFFDNDRLGWLSRTVFFHPFEPSIFGLIYKDHMIRFISNVPRLNSYSNPSFANGSMRHKGQSQRTPGGTGSSIERGNTINRIKQSDHLKMQYQITISTRILIWVRFNHFSSFCHSDVGDKFCCDGDNFKMVKVLRCWWQNKESVTNITNRSPI